MATVGSWPNLTEEDDNGTTSAPIGVDPNRETRLLYVYTSCLLIGLCLVCVTVNSVILASVCWMRRSHITPTLHISLSLAGSDVYNSLMVGVGLVLNSLLPVGLERGDLLHPCASLTLEAVRMGGMYTTMFHLLALAANHYLGISRPLHYPSLVTHFNISLVALVLWVVPPLGFIGYFSLIQDDGFNNPDCTHKFIVRSQFRRQYCCILLVCVCLMAGIYCHIFVLVRRHQKNRNKFRRTSYSRPSTQATGSGKRPSGKTASNSEQQQQQQQTRNEKAVCTTLLIVGSVLLGWLPAIAYFYLVCEDCPIPRDWGNRTQITLTNAFINLLLILKTGLNSYIYAARMHEIKAATGRMRRRLIIACCLMCRDRDAEEEWRLGGGYNSELSTRNYLSRASTKKKQHQQCSQRHHNYGQHHQLQPQPTTTLIVSTRGEYANDNGVNRQTTPL